MGQEQSQECKAEHRDYTPKELRKYNGLDDSVATLVAMKGKIFDVSSSALYKADGSYHKFAGRDITIPLAKNRTDITDADDSWNLEQLTADEVKALNEWLEYYEKKYPLVGNLLREPQTETSNTTKQETKEVQDSNNNSIQDPDKIHHDWNQTISHATIAIYVKNAKNEQVKSDITSTGLKVSIQFGQSDKEFHLDIKLNSEIVSEETKMDIKPDKIEFKMKKKENAMWSSL